MDRFVNHDLAMTAYRVRKQEGRTHVNAKAQLFDGKDSYLSFFGIFNGHHGEEAADYARENLKTFIDSQEEFWADDDESISTAIRGGFISCNDGMWHESRNWPRTSLGFPSMSGTGASVALFTRGKLFTGHVGDSKIVLGYKDPKSLQWMARTLTKEHTPSDPFERIRIVAAGGGVVGKDGMAKVVWRRPKAEQLGCVTQSGVLLIEEVPFLSVSRSLGDLWSYNYDSRAHIVCPVPDVEAHEIDDSAQFLIMGNKSLWNIISPEAAVQVVAKNLCDIVSEQVAKSEDSVNVSGRRYVNSDSIYKLKSQFSKILVDYAVERLPSESLHPDNIFAVTVLINRSIHSLT